MNKIQTNIKKVLSLLGGFWLSYKKRIIVFLFSSFLMVFFALVGIVFWVRGQASDFYDYSSLESVPSQYDVGIVFGAAISYGGQPSTVLADRVEAAVELYEAGVIDKIVMSGDNRFVDYNEPGVMQRYAIELGVEEEDIVMDFAGRRTYDTCFRAKEIFKIERAVLITQKYHLYRATYTCSKLGVDNVGYIADGSVYPKLDLWKQREVLATWVAWWQLNVTHPKPVLGQPEPID